MDAYEFEMTPEDMGEIVELVRISHLKMGEDVSVKS